MEYFRLDKKKDFLENVEKPYDSENIGTKWYFDTRSKLQYLIDLIQNQLNIELINNYNEKPNGMAGQGKGFKLKHYVLAGFISKKYFGKIKKDCFVKIQFCESNGELIFNTDVDVNFSDSSNKYTINRDVIQKDTTEFWKIDDSFPNNWNDLILLILPSIKKNISYLENYLDNQTLDIFPNQINNKLLMKLLSLNQILYGPPGTGKTYHTINKALSIIEGKSENDLLKEDRKKLKQRFDAYLKSEQIVFTTFHQSMSYEDFIEGIKPKIDEDSNENKQVIYEVESGIFKRIVKNAKKERTSKKEIIEEYNFDDAWDELFNEAEKKLEDNNPLKLHIQTPNLGLKIVEISERGNLKLKPIYSDDAKVYTVSYDRTKKLQNAFPNLSVVKNIDKEFRAVIGGSNSTAYWSVLNFINNRINQGAKTVNKEYATLLPHVLIIDEINRGNVSQIFGELITLIEESKRLGNDEALEVTLPYSKETFGVPPNLYIIGTMNTADRSVEALDTALRRRFSFEEMMPQTELLSPSALYCKLLWDYEKVDWDDKEFMEKEDKLFLLLGVSDELKIERKEIWNTHMFGKINNDFTHFDHFHYTGINLKVLLETINKRIELLLDRDHTIGHSYFINVTSLEDLENTFKNNIIPLLQEYFYNDYEKIALVLGEGFVEIKKPQDNQVKFAKLSVGVEQPEIQTVFAIREDFDIQKAINLLGVDE